jgi:hypothetical protein
VPLRPRAVAALTTLILQAWFNGVCRSLGSRRSGFAAVAAAGVVLLAWLVVGTLALDSQLALDASAAKTLAEPLVAPLFAFPAILAVVATLYSPERSVMHDLLAVMPVRPGERVAATQFLVTAASVAVGGVWSAPLVWQLAKHEDIVALTLVLVCAAAIATIGSLTAQVLFAAASAGLDLLLRHGFRALSRGLAGAGVSLAVLWSMTQALPVQGRVHSEGPLTVLALPLRHVVEGGPAVASIGATICAVVVLAVALPFMTRLGDRSGARSHSASPHRRLRTRRQVTLTELELVSWVRFAPNAAFFTFAGIMLLIALVVVGSSTDAQSFEVGLLFLALASTVGIGSFGPTRATHWIYNISGRPYRWIVPKLASVVCIWACFVALTTVSLSLFTAWEARNTWLLLPSLAIEMVAGMLVGIVLPVSGEQSLGNAFSEMVAVLVILSIAFGIQSLPWMTSTVGAALTYVASAVVGATLYIVIAREQSRDPLRVT